MTLGELMGPEALLGLLAQTTVAELVVAGFRRGLLGLCHLRAGRAVKPGYLFAALPGSRTDGARYIADALARGAAAILIPQGSGQALDGTPVVEDADPRRRLALIAASSARNLKSPSP